MKITRREPTEEMIEVIVSNCEGTIRDLQRLNWQIKWDAAPDDFTDLLKAVVEECAKDFPDQNIIYKRISKLRAHPWYDEFMGEGNG